MSNNDMREALQAARDALEEIALAGMSGTGQESEDGMRAWHARRAWEFIGIAARALDPIRAALAAPAPVALTPAQQHADELVVALRGVMNLHTYKIHTASAWDGLLKRARAVLAAIEAAGEEGDAA
jgi:hypothetical protein